MAKCFMKVLGIVFVIIGVLGFFLPLYGWLHLTAAHNLIHLVSGIIFLAVSNHEQNSRTAARIFGVIYLATAIWGLFTNDILGLIMATPATNTIHFIVAALALYAGFKPAASAESDQSKSA